MYHRQNNVHYWYKLLEISEAKVKLVVDLDYPGGQRYITDKEWLWAMEFADLR